MNRIVIPGDWGFLREPLPTVAERSEMTTLGNTFESMYDFDTLFNDAIYIGDNRVILVGPPLYDIKSKIRFTDGKKLLTPQYMEMDRSCTTVINLDPDDSDLYIEYNGDHIKVTINYPSTIFDGRRLMGTIQKDEPIHWIKEWITYYHTVHGVDGFVIYNNKCEKYTVEELQTQLNGMYDDVVIEVVDYQSPLGGFTKSWNSNFAQMVMYEHIKYKYAWCADLFLNNDIDELLVLYDGLTLDSVYNQILSSNSEGIIYGAQNIDPYNEKYGKDAIELPVDKIHYRDYYYWGHHINNKNIYGTNSIAKWFIIPERAMGNQWMTHYIGGQHSCMYVQKDPKVINLCHFYALQSPNKKHRQLNRSTAKDGDLIKDEYLEILLKETFN